MTEPIYLLCSATSLVCFLLLARAWARTRVPLLFWCAVCFLGFAINNALLLLPESAVPQLDLRFWRKIPALVGLLLLQYGFTREVRR